MVCPAGAEKRIMVYFAQETQQRWGKPGPVGTEDGAALWLPGGILLELRMVPPVRLHNAHRQIRVLVPHRTQTD
jgi:hypothetical protein